MNLRNYRQRLESDEKAYETQRLKIKDRQEKLHKATAKLENVTEFDVQILRRDRANASIMINTTGWKYANLTRYDFRDNQTNIAYAIRKGLGIIGSRAKSVIQGAEGMLKSGVKAV